MKNKTEIKKKLGHFKVWEHQANKANLARILGKLGKIGKLGREISFKKFEKAEWELQKLTLIFNSSCRCTSGQNRNWR